jgi:hypothetical protein
MRRCFQCGTRIDATQLIAVGDGEFCPACFRQLLASEASPIAATSELEVRQSRAPQQPVASEQRAPSSRPASSGPVSSRPGKAGSARREKAPPSSSRFSKSRACLVCERDIRGEAAISFLGGDLCAVCNRQMERELRDAEAAPALVTDAAPTGTTLAEASPATPVPEPPAAPMALFTPGGETRWCAGCERPMPGPGSYRMIEGEPYCSACIPFYSTLDLGAHPRRPKQELADGGAFGGATGGCDCCGAALEQGAERHEGFSFCRACSTSDRELALSVARVRHRRKLEALRASFDPEKKQ